MEGLTHVQALDQKTDNFVQPNDLLYAIMHSIMSRKLII